MASLTLNFVIVALLCAVIVLMARAFLKKERYYRESLEGVQKAFDYQSSRLNILTRALTNMAAIILNDRSSDSWKKLALDEARALIRADGAGFWRFVERDQRFERDLVLGSPPRSADWRRRLDRREESADGAFRKRAVVIDSFEGPPAEDIVWMPLHAGDQFLGTFSFWRSGPDRIQRRDAELVAMFIGQVELALTNRDMVLNREKFYLELVQSLADLLDARDASTDGQTRKVRGLARSIAREMELPDEFIYYLEFAALMHDIGKIAIDESLLKKPGSLTPEELEKIRQHPELGHRILAPVSMLAPVAPMVLYHQEWYNGKGYPEGLAGEEIPLGARIVAVLDAWSAMTSRRPWRPPLSKKDALKELQKGSGTQFDPKVVEAFLAVLEKQGDLAAA